MEWISVKERLPEAGVYVGVRLRDRPWHDSTDQDGVFTQVAKLVRGISEDERRALPDCDRKILYKFGDEYGNNAASYAWNEWGPGSYFGQEVTHWFALPAPPEE